ncbi:MAG TPA: hypothetical protein VFH78_08405 [Candidatus Thermoplasmatota archaeon]|nr:hypothetical protein [Candidatus Thermoplasmatota archaeon]
MRPGMFPLVVAALLLAGCAEAPSEGGGDLAPGAGDAMPHSLHGTFTQERTDATLDAWCDVAQRYGNPCMLMESFPEQYRLGFSSLEECTSARDELLAIEHARPGACEPDLPSSRDPETPVSSPPEGAWSLHGTFAHGYTQEDLDAWCALAEELGQTCALMKSEPPQFSWRFASLEACEDARARLAQIAAVRAESCRSDA